MAAGRLRGEALDKPRRNGAKAERTERACGAGAKAEGAGMTKAKAERAGGRGSSGGAKRAETRLWQRTPPALDTPRMENHTPDTTNT